MRELFWMAEGKARREWDHTAQITFVTASVFGGKQSFANFHPYIDNAPRGIRWTPENNDAIIRAFTQRN